MDGDLRQVGLTEEASEKVVRLRTETPYFSEESDVYRLAVAVAVAMKSDVSDSLKSAHYKTKFRVIDDYSDESEISARLDTPDGRLARFVAVHRPEASSEPYRYSQYLAVIGINFLFSELIDKEKTLSATLRGLQSR